LLLLGRHGWVLWAVNGVLRLEEYNRTMTQYVRAGNLLCFCRDRRATWNVMMNVGERPSDGDWTASENKERLWEYMGFEVYAPQTFQSQRIIQIYSPRLGRVQDYSE
jgi:hypothetical protein